MFLILCAYRRDEPRGLGSVGVICEPIPFGLQQGIVVALEKSTKLFSGDNCVNDVVSVTRKICNVVLNLRLNIKVTLNRAFSWCSTGVFHVIEIICQKVYFVEVTTSRGWQY